MTFESPNTRYMEKGKDARRCPKCGSTKIELDHEHYEAYCKNCSYVINDYSIEYGRQHSRTMTHEGLNHD